MSEATKDRWRQTNTVSAEMCEHISHSREEGIEEDTGLFVGVDLGMSSAFPLQAMRLRRGPQLKGEGPQFIGGGPRFTEKVAKIYRKGTKIHRREN